MTLTNNKGFTIMELVVAIGIISIITALVMSLYFRIMISGQVGSAQINLQIQGRSATDEMTEIIKLSKTVLNFQDIYTTDSDTAILNIPAIDANQNLLTSNDVIVFDYDSANKQLNEITFPAPDSARLAGAKILASNLSLISFTYLYHDSANPGSGPVAIPCMATSSQPVKLFHFATVYAVAIEDCDLSVIEAVDISITLEQTFGNKQATITINDEARLRNK